jgi:hypothetical protein
MTNLDSLAVDWVGNVIADWWLVKFKELKKWQQILIINMAKSRYLLIDPIEMIVGFEKQNKEPK